MIRILALGLLLALPLAAQEGAAPSPLDAAAARITPDGLKAHLAEIAGDAYEGRNSGFPGNDKAGEYIAAHFNKIGLQPAGEKGEDGKTTWFQGFKVGGRPTRNVLGMVEGSDAALKSEFIVIGAHYDHVGKTGEPSAGRMKNPGGEDDTIWNGADDNGSGTVTVLEIARAFMDGKVKTKRSILFMTFSGEEWGLIGSKHYVDNPLIPLASIAAMINLDMVGRNGTKPMDVGGVGTAEAWIELCEAAAKGTGLEYKTSPAVMAGSDHYSFARKRIPAVHFFTGFHEDYHRQTDHAEKIDFDRMAKIGKFGLRLLAITADRTPRMEYTGSSSRVFGVEAENLDEDAAADLKLPEGEGGLKIMKVSADSAAAGAGVKEGDVIVSFNGKTFDLDDPLSTLRKELKAVKDGVEVPVVVLRDGKRVELKAVWGKKKSY